MEHYTITKEQILQLHKMNKEGNDQLVSCDLENWFPDAFKKEMELNKWYIPETEKGSLWFIKSILENGKGEGYGFIKGDYKECEHILINESRFRWREATHQEIETALIAEAKKIGFVDGAKFKSSISEKGQTRTVNELNWNFYPSENSLNISTPENEWQYNQSNPVIFKDGKWAEIIPEETKVITMDKAVKILSKKYGKQVEIK